MTEKAMFADAVPGDRVWCPRFGFGVVHYNMAPQFSEFPICVDFDSGYSEVFQLDGRCSKDDLNPSLFWDEIKFEIPPRPNFKYHTGEVCQVCRGEEKNES